MKRTLGNATLEDVGSYYMLILADSIELYLLTNVTEGYKDPDSSYRDFNADTLHVYDAINDNVQTFDSRSIFCRRYYKEEVRSVIKNFFKWSVLNN